jgi:hypothetical protein
MIMMALKALLTQISAGTAPGAWLMRDHGVEEIGASLADRLSRPARSAAALARRDYAAAALQGHIEQLSSSIVSIGDVRPMHAAAAIIAGRDPFGEQFSDEVVE